MFSAKHVLLALFIAPLASGILQALTMWAPSGALLAAPFAFVGLVALGLPLHYLFRQSPILRSPLMVLVGAAASLIFSALFFALTNADASILTLVGAVSVRRADLIPMPTAALGLCILCLHGALVSLIYWLVAVRHVQSAAPPLINGVRLNAVKLRKK